MTREDQLDFCQACKNKKFSMAKGVICSLTDEQATFQENCLDYVEDSIEKEKHLANKERKREIYIEDESLGLSTEFGVKNGILAGQIAIALAVLWFFVGITFMDRIFFYPIVLVVLGIISWNRGLSRKNEESHKK